MGAQGQFGGHGASGQNAFLGEAVRLVHGDAEEMVRDLHGDLVVGDEDELHLIGGW